MRIKQNKTHKTKCCFEYGERLDSDTVYRTFPAT